MTNSLRWTDEQGRAYENARETITHYIGLVQHEIYSLENRFGEENRAVIALRAYLVDVSIERQHMNITDDAEISSIQSKYNRLIAGISEQAIAA